MQEALDGLPDEYAKLLTNVAVVVEKEPPPRGQTADLDMDEGEDLLGPLPRPPIDKESFFQAGGQLPAKISIIDPSSDHCVAPNRKWCRKCTIPSCTRSGIISGFDDDEMPY